MIRVSDAYNMAEHGVLRLRRTSRVAPVHGLHERIVVFAERHDNSRVMTWGSYDETSRHAVDIVAAIPREDVTHFVRHQISERKFSALVRDLNRSALSNGEQAHAARVALRKLGFPD